jgi:hypothetical protein
MNDCLSSIVAQNTATLQHAEQTHKGIVLMYEVGKLQLVDFVHFSLQGVLSTTRLMQQAPIL